MRSFQRSKIIFCLVLLCACSGPARTAHAQTPLWDAVEAKVAQKKWQEGVAIMDGVPVAKLRPNEVAAYCYFMGVCAYNTAGREAFGRACLVELLQHRMHRISDPAKRAEIKNYVVGLLNRGRRGPAIRLVVVEAGASHSAAWFSGKGFWLTGTTKVEPLTVLKDAVILPRADLLTTLEMPEDKIVPTLEAQMNLGDDGIVRGVRTTNTYSLIAIGDKTQPPAPLMREQLTAWSGEIDQALAFFKRDFGVTLPQERMALFTVDDTKRLQAVSGRLHGVKQNSLNIGYSVPDEYTAVATGEYNEHRNTGTLYHELCHIVFQNDFPAIPAWLDEGIASVYSVFRFDKGSMVGATDWNRSGTGQWRAEILIRVGKWHPSATELVRMSSEEFLEPQQHRDGYSPSFFEAHFQEPVALQAANNATACYLLLYLQKEGKLSSLYKSFRDRDVLKTTDLKTTEEVGDADVKLLKQVAGDEIDKDFENWLPKAIPGYRK